MSNPLIKRFFRYAKWAIGIYLLIGLLIYTLQDYLLFHPKVLPAGYTYAFQQPFKEINLNYDSRININIIQFTTSDRTPKGIVLYFHGNRKNIDWYAKFAPRFTQQGYEVWMMDYPGFGKSTGELTEQRMYDWALQTYQLANARIGADSIIIYGKSLGTGVAAQLAATKDCKRVILETPYYSLPDVVGSYAPIYPLQRMIKYHFPVHEYLPLIPEPITIFHGTNDWVIHYSQAKKLQALLKPTDAFITIEGGDHNNLNDYKVMQVYIDSLLR
jgi:alpha-beta hydrolase superfamily lysophospholipase